MNLKELQKAYSSLVAEAEAALNDDNMELFTEKQAEAEKLQGKINAAKALDKMKGGIEKEDPPAKSVERPPFDTDTEDKDEPEDSFAKSVYVVRYGDIGPATKAVIRDLYGSDYYNKREGQRTAFAKYVRTGRLNAREEESLKGIILTEDLVEKEIKSGYTVGEIKATLQESVLDLGGVLVPEDYRQEIIRRLAGMTIVRGRARQVNTIRDAAEWPKLEGGNSRYTSAVRVTWVDEIPASATTAETNPTFGMYRIPVHTVMARTDLSRNMLEDSAFNMLQVMAELFAEASAIDEDEEFLIGTGGGRPRGILANRSGANQTPEDGVSSANSGNASAMTADGLIDLAYTLDAQYRGNAVFFAAKNTHRDIRKLKDGNGDYLWERGLKAGEPPSLLGYSFLESEAMPAVAANNYPLVFGDLRGYLIVDRVGMSVERVADTTTVGTNKVALFMRRRLGGQVIEPWRFVAQKVSA